MPGFEHLEVWQRSVDLSAEIYLVTDGIHDQGYREQITRAGLSVPSNIAEGMERQTVADKIKFLDYARGSAGELRTQAIVGAKAGLLSRETSSRLVEESRQISAMIQGLIRSLRSI